MYLFAPPVVAAYGMPRKTEFPWASSNPLTGPCAVKAVGEATPLTVRAQSARSPMNEVKVKPMQMAFSATFPRPMLSDNLVV